MALIKQLKKTAWELGVRVRHPRRSVRDLINHQVFGALATEIYDESWDLLVVLDACRPDLMSEVAAEGEYGFLGDVGVRYSPGSSSQQWLAANFTPDHATEMVNTAYVTGNPFSDELLDASDFGTLAEVWKASWNEKVGTIPPRPITDRAIKVARSTDVDRLVIHYMQPHFPSLTDPELGSRVDPETNVWIDPVWDRLASGDLSRERVWNAYRANLERVLEDVAILLENVDAPRTVITADHGNGFGEDGVYGHPRLRVHRSLRAIPWVRTAATDERTHDPRTDHREEATDDVVQERLRDLGYR